MVQKIGKNQKWDQILEISEKDDILAAEEKRISLIGNRTKKALNYSKAKRVRGETVETIKDED